MGTTTFSGPVVSQGGFIDASFTTAERDAIVSPQPGLLIYNTTSNTYEVYSGTAWDTAFGPGGGGAGGFPSFIDNLTSYNAPTSMAVTGKATKILFSPDGMQALTLGNFGFNTAVLAAAYDIGSTYNTYGFNASYYSNPLGACFNFNGTTIYTFDAQSDATVVVRSYGLNVPYDLTQANTATETIVSTFFIGTSMNNDYARGFEVSSDGTKLMFSVSGNGFSYLRTFTLAAPYDFTSINSASYTGNVDITNYVANLHYMGSGRIWGLAVDSTGTVVYGSVNGYVGMSYAATFIIEFKLGTAYDVSSIQASYNQATQAPVDLSSSNFGVTLADSNIYIGGYDMMYGNPRYNVNSLTTLAAPNITGVSPSSGPSGTTVTITGTGFTGATSVAFGSSTISSSMFNTITSTQIQVSAPPTGTNSPVDVVVTNPAGTSTEVAAFANTSPPSTTYSAGADYNGNGVQVSSTQLIINEYNWSNLVGASDVIAKQSGTPFTALVSGYGIVTGTLTSNFSGGAGSYFANVSGQMPPGPGFNCDYITI